MLGAGIAIFFILVYLAHTLAFYLRVRKGEREKRSEKTKRTVQRTFMPSWEFVHQNSKKAHYHESPDLAVRDVRPRRSFHGLVLPVSQGM